MRQRPMALEEAGRPIRVAVIRCGRFGSAMAAQIMRALRMGVGGAESWGVQVYVEDTRSGARWCVCRLLGSEAARGL